MVTRAKVIHQIFKQKRDGGAFLLDINKIFSNKMVTF